MRLSTKFWSNRRCGNRLLAAALLAAVIPAAGAASAPLDDEFGRLAAKASERGTVRVLARLDVAAAPAASLGKEQAAAQRDAIATAAAVMERDLAGTTWRTTRVFRTIPYVALEVSAEALQALRRSGVVRDVGEDRLERVMLPDSVPQIEADLAWDDGYDGTGWVVAVLDTGVSRDHPFLAGKVVSEACFSRFGDCPNGSEEQIGTGAAAPCDYAPIACPHGTHVAGIASGRGMSLSGTARGAGIIAIQVFSRFTGSSCNDDIEEPCAKAFTSDTIAALEHVFELRDEHRIAAVNLSLGGGSFSSQAACDAADAARKLVIDNLRAAGIATVAAAGNEATPNALIAPACISSAISVGAVNRSDRVAGFSNSAPFLDFLAPGTSILSSVPPSGFEPVSGTSQATPHVAGAFAILNQRLARADVEAVTEALRATGVPVRDQRTGRVTPRIAIHVALELLSSPTCSGRVATIVGTEGPDRIIGTPGPDVIVGLGGDDLIDGRRGDDVICGGTGDDDLRGGPGSDELIGGGGADVLRGGSGNDSLAGGRGNDRLRGDGGDDTLKGGAGNDVLAGGGGHDSLNGQHGDDDLSGNFGRDACVGGPGSDVGDLTCETVSSVP